MMQVRQKEGSLSHSSPPGRKDASSETSVDVERPAVQQTTSSTRRTRRKLGWLPGIRDVLGSGIVALLVDNLIDYGLGFLSCFRCSMVDANVNSFNSDTIGGRRKRKKQGVSRLKTITAYSLIWMIKPDNRTAAASGRSDFG